MQVRLGGDRAGEALPEQVERFGHAFVEVLQAGHHLVVGGRLTPSDAEVEAAVGEVVEQGGLFGDVDGIVQRQERDCSAHTDA